MSTEPIADYALQSDCRSAALVSAAGSVDWLCFPRFDSPSVFGRLLGEDAGHWSIRPCEEFSTSQRYVGPSLVLESVHTTAGGRLAVTDALALGAGRRGHDLGQASPGTLLRQVCCLEGAVDVRVGFAPRPGYGVLRPVLEAVDGGLRVRAGAEELALSTPVPFDVDGGTGSAVVSLSAGEVVGFALHRQRRAGEEPVLWDQQEIAGRLTDTIAGWTSWSGMHQNYNGPWEDLVAGSGRVLQALWVAACPDEAGKFFQFLATAAACRLPRGEELQIMYGIGGERDLTERVLDHLPGWRGSAPVRIGNGAWHQRQLDVYGELLDAAATMPEFLPDLPRETLRFLADAADAAAARWRDRDQGIWEVRGEPRHYLYSKLMCWVAVDRAITLAEVLQAADRVPRWQEAREQIADSICANGWSDAAGAYTQAYGTEHLDASALMLAIVGFLPAGDPRFLATIEAIEQRLTDSRGLVYRYHGDDGLAGEEGAFLLCTFWLAQALALAGLTERAREVFERAAGFATALGLMAEEVAPDSRELLGNFPQAFSHIGLVNAAWAIREAERRSRSSTA